MLILILLSVDHGRSSHESSKADQYGISIRSCGPIHAYRHTGRYEGRMLPVWYRSESVGPEI